MPHRSVLVFATDSHGDAAGQLADIVNDVIKSRLASSDQYDPSGYTLSLPSIRRSLNEHTLSTKDASPPFDTVPKVRRLAQLAGYDMAVTSSIDDYEYNAATHKATVYITITLIDLTNDKAPPRSFGDNMATPDNSVKGPDDLQAATNTARTLAEKIMTQLLEPAKPATPPAAKSGSGR